MKKTARQIAYEVLVKVAGKKVKSKKDDFAASLAVPAEDDLFGGDVNLEQKKETPKVPEVPVTPEAPKSIINVEPEFRRGRAGVGLIDPTVQKKQELAADQARANSVRERLTQPGSIKAVDDENFEVVGKKFAPPATVAKIKTAPKLKPGPAAVSVGEGDFTVAREGKPKSIGKKP